jgi:hypothetical protein
MNTPSHAILNLLIFNQQLRTQASSAIVIGAVLPDIPIFVFYFLMKFVYRKIGSKAPSFYDGFLLIDLDSLRISSRSTSV